MKKIKLFKVDNMLRLATITSLLIFNMVLGNAIKNINLLHVLLSTAICLGLYIYIENDLNRYSKKPPFSTSNKDIEIDVPIDFE